MPRQLRLLILLPLLLAGCASSGGLRPFTSDGCSLFPDRSPFGGSDWCECCLEHDLAYWRGGSPAQREAADRKLAQCVVAHGGSPVLGESMYVGTRLGGLPWLYTWFRWAYGWPYGRGFAPLSAEESATADHLEQEYQDSGKPAACAP